MQNFNEGFYKAQMCIDLIDLVNASIGMQKSINHFFSGHQIFIYCLFLVVLLHKHKKLFWITLFISVLRREAGGV